MTAHSEFTKWHLKDSESKRRDYKETETGLSGHNSKHYFWPLLITWPGPSPCYEAAGDWSAMC